MHFRHVLFGKPQTITLYKYTELFIISHNLKHTYVESRAPIKYQDLTIHLLQEFKIYSLIDIVMAVTLAHRAYDVVSTLKFG